ncbi:MAG: methionine biosynthesis protein MetW [Caulobacterales bacterium]|jgi:methionine biosynthesis protein MetW
MKGGRTDLSVIASMVEPASRVLDIGCGDGALLDLLQRERNVRGRGMELSQAGVNACVARGLSVVQGDADKDLVDYPDTAFDYVILSKTIQAVRRPPHVLTELLRIGKRAIISFPNVGHWQQRLRLLTSGRMPTPGPLNGRWYDSDTLHLCTVRDFAELSKEQGLLIERAIPISNGVPGAPFAKSVWVANWMAEEAVFLLQKK